MKTTVYQSKAHFSQTGQRLASSLHEVSEEISAGLAQRLARYAQTRLEDAGFVALGERIEVYTLDADEPPANRAYTVRFQHEKGGYLEVSGILTRRGWPSLDHGFAIGEEG